MKIKSLQLIGIAAGLIPLAAYSRDYLSEYSTIQSVTFTLIATWEEAALRPRDDAGKVIPGGDLVFDQYYSVESATKTVTTDEDASKMATEKVSNKEILMRLKEEGVIESITGYSISVISTENEEYYDEYYDVYYGEDSGPIFYLTKTGMPPLNISEYLRVLDDDIGVETSSWKRVTTLIGDNETWTETGRSNGMGLAAIAFDLTDMSAYVRGVVNFSNTLKTFGTGETKFSAWIPNAGRFNNVAGKISYGYYYEYYDEISEEYYEEFYEESDELLQGSISIGAGKLYDFPTLP